MTFAGTSVPTEGRAQHSHRHQQLRRRRAASSPAARSRPPPAAAPTTSPAPSRSLCAISDFAFGTQGPAAFGQLRNQYQLSGGSRRAHRSRQALHVSPPFQLGRRYDDLIDLLNASPSTLDPARYHARHGRPSSSKVRQLGVPLTSPNVPAASGGQFRGRVPTFRLPALRRRDADAARRFPRHGAGREPHLGVLPPHGGHRQRERRWRAVPGPHVAHWRRDDQRLPRLRLALPDDDRSVPRNLPGGPSDGRPGSRGHGRDAGPLGFGVSSLGFGGSPAVPQRTFNDYVESTNEISAAAGRRSAPDQVRRA